jgi:hypothetical protein
MKVYTPASFTPSNYSWYSFLLEAESTQGPDDVSIDDNIGSKNQVVT